MKEQILKLRSEGKNYNEIQEIVGCSKGTISYHCGEGQKRKSNLRNQKNRLNKKGINRICEYGCNSRAIYILKNGKWCCNKNNVHCMAVRRKNAESRTKYLDRTHEIIKICNESKSLLQASRTLKIPYHTILRHAKRLGVYKYHINKHITAAQKDEFIKICKNSKTMAQARKKLNLSFTTFKRIATRLKVYFPNQGSKGVPQLGWSIKIPYKIEDILSNKNIKVSSVNSYRKRLIKFKIKKYICELCNRTKWNGKPIPLELDHIDGDKKNNRLINLRIICPNCHAQTPNYKGKNTKKHKMKRLSQQQQK